MNKAASKLGKMAKGKPKNFSAAELERRRKRMIALNRARKASKAQ